MVFSQWLEARTTFTRSCATWSVVGHLVGLGDRHGDNILVDTTNAELVHVDFGNDIIIASVVSCEHVYPL